ncbi:class I SAM-dependent methyltransferase [Plantactinospora sp. S1510]|uniref:Class I SAM-dependent methyltransferase n=1 Tax=Plantactinospora alkalitolerans TaxID=2789879 RepID=A0ABS0GTV1_9ACTN|nr:class I SAM-dependent methyltransferase [Plantactinospora alkalitolerans]MBF9129610.1 class I SAM-dependent methyltransferase [Plantactinospora alkalitolerans]
MTSPIDILDYYRRGGEHARLTGGVGRLEYLRTLDVLTRTLPPAPAVVLDVGGGTGVYAEPLAAAGYRMHLLDLLPEHAAAAAGRAGVTALAGDARSLPVPDGRFDAVLLLGPLYHLLDRAERVTAWREAARAVRPGGLVVAATISRYASLFDGFVKGLFDDPEFRPVVERTLADGRHLNTRPERNWFTSAYFHHPAEPASEATEAGLAVRRVVTVEGPLGFAGGRLNEILADPEQTALLLEMSRRVEAEPSLLGASGHLLTVAWRPGAADPVLDGTAHR